ncbi:lytic transglycosylase domain-containing protein [Arthrobacter liuii]|uniref:Uncharacterized protein n=1 Tax=Arthrobacter liuii TaxID=1476996 RepID=A0ABQ2AKL0_9MICC|nr:lytic transglycosylase domain-containing protein [Arthrobacter liuii]GGH92680.1 hypothetical protein GCM10007170_11800 [Arthrobacter liuii]
MPLSVTISRYAVMGSLIATALAATMVLPAAAEAPAPPGGYPSWTDVQDAQASEAAKAAEITTINGLLTGLQAQSERAGEAAVRSAAGYAAADAALQAATSRLDALSAQAAHAADELARHRKELGALAVRSYKTGGTNAGFFVALDVLETNSVQGLNLVKVVGDKTAALLSNTAAAGKVAAALTEQEKVARSERERLSGEAKAKQDAARSAQDALARQVSEEQRHGGELTAQLAALKGTTAALEGEYRQGQAALAAYEAAQAAKRAAAEEQARVQAETAANAAAAAGAARQPKPAAPAGAAANAANPAPADPALSNPALSNPAPVNNPAPSVPDAPQAPSLPAPPAVVVPSVPGGAVNDPAGATGCLRLGAGPVPVPGPAVDQGVQLADHRHKRLFRSVRNRPGPAARQVRKCRQ